MKNPELDAMILQQMNKSDIESWLKQRGYSRSKTLYIDIPSMVFTLDQQEGDGIEKGRHAIHDGLFLNQKSHCNYIKVHMHSQSQFRVSHRHEFIELNYMYRGSCVNCIQGKDYRMQEGDIVIFDTRTTHDIKEVGPEDTLLNIILVPHEVEGILQELLPGTSELSSFIFNTVYDVSKEANYLYFPIGSNYSFDTTMQNFLMECLAPRSEMNTILLNCYLKSLFAILAQECRLNPEGVDRAYRADSKVSAIIRYIRDHCRSCTLESVAENFGYTKSYISMLLKEHSEHSFIKLRNEFRLEAIKLALSLDSSKSIRTLMEEYGFTNSTYFYNLYKERFGTTPGDGK